MTKGFTKRHSNRRAYNWLIYECYERIMLSDAFSSHLTGILYDFGSGESPYKDYFLNYVDRYVAVDWAGSYHDTKADIVADLNQPLPIKSEVADTVVSLSVLEHLRNPQLMLNEAFRILKPGGSIVLQVPWQWWVHEAPYDFFRYSPYGLKYLLEQAGFVNVVVESQSGYFTTAILKWNYFTGRFIPPKPLGWLVMAALLPLWYLGQKVAPFLDKLDHDWALETSGYFATAKKP